MGVSDEEFTTMELFAGAGGGVIASKILGHTPLVAYEWDAYCCQVLRERAEDGWFPGMLVREGDIRLQDTSEWRGRISCITGSFPCQDISVAGNQAGVGEGERSGLYREVLRISDEVRPDYIFLENVSAIVTGADGEWLRTILGDLAERGLDAVWCCLSAAEVGANHKRDRWWLLGYPKHTGQPASEITGRIGERSNSHKARKEQASEPSGSGEQHEDVADTKRIGQQGQGECLKSVSKKKNREGQAGDVVDGCLREFWAVESEVGRVVDGMAHRLHSNAWNEIEAQVGRVTDETQNRADKLKALGNAQVPLQCAVAFSYLWELMEAANES